MNNNKFYLLITVFFAFQLFSCAGNIDEIQIRPILGNWLTDKGIEVSIKPTPDTGVSAVIVSSGQFLGGETTIGNVILTQIKPLVDGGYSGLFPVPRKEKAPSC